MAKYTPKQTVIMSKPAASSVRVAADRIEIRDDNGDLLGSGTTSSAAWKDAVAFLGFDGKTSSAWAYDPSKPLPAFVSRNMPEGVQIQGYRFVEEGQS